MKVLITSPAVANGINWLVNCLLELDIMCYLESPELMWKEQEKRLFQKLSAYSWDCKIPYRYELHLPVLLNQEKKKFLFRNDIYVEWHHIWPNRVKQYDKVILFVRDPRDSMWSAYKRQQMDCSFYEFITWIQYTSMMNFVDAWNCFYLTWLKMNNVIVIHFEDYKKDAEATLIKVLNALDLKYSMSKVRKATLASTHEKAREAEDRFYHENPQLDKGIRINRASKVGDFANASDNAESFAYIESATAPVRKLLGYPVEEPCAALSYDLFRSFIRANEWFSFMPEFLYADACAGYDDKQFSFDLLNKIYRFIESAPYVRWKGYQYHWGENDMTVEAFFKRFVKLQQNILRDR